MPTIPQMNVALGEGLRRLPVYLLLDCSGSMAGAPLEAVKRGLELYVQQLTADAQARNTVHTSLIGFNSEAWEITGLVSSEELESQVRSLQLKAEGLTALGEAISLLMQSMDRDLKLRVRPGENAKGDWKPITFILTDGKPTDDWQGPRQKILARQQAKLVNLVTVGCGPDIDDATLRLISMGPTFRMDSTDASFRAFFQWATQSIVQASQQLSRVPDPAANPQAMQGTPPPPVLQFVC